MDLRSLACVACATSALACAGRSDVDVQPPDAGADADASVEADGGPPPVPRTGKLDLLLVIDNSQDTDVAQQLFDETLDYLIGRLAAPACVNGLGNVVAQTASPNDPCPAGQREFAPLASVHIGIVSTSLGGHGADICSPASTVFNPTQNDAGHLLSRAGGGGSVPTYDNNGFLTWDPDQTQSPPGDSDLTELKAKLHDIAHGVGTSGCGFESQLESIYRFLVDPEPYASITVTGNQAEPVGTDGVVLQQRADFLRPDSAVAVVLVSDENDCSTRESGGYFYSNQVYTANGAPYHLPRARSECAKNPDDPCCGSCGSSPHAGCSPNEADPECQLPPMDDTEDPINLRCFDQKRRFGIDFLYPVDRYVGMFTQSVVTKRDGTVVPNGLFAAGRSPKQVFFTAIVGVPWQDVAADPGDLGVGYLPGSQVDWSSVVGDPATETPPADPLMVESIAPRQGTNPATGVPLAPPDAMLPLANPINGHERLIAEVDDLQYACIYPRPTPLDCQGATPNCECTGDRVATNPICQQPDGTYTTVQQFVRATPSIRQLRVVQGLGDQGVVASVCAQIVSGTSHRSFGYKPGFDALLRELRKRLIGGPDHE